ncbi:MAG: hypothetical protein ACR65W_20150, partial [Methylocystis sp.]
MADFGNTTTETGERPGAIVEALREAGVDCDLTMRVFGCIENERALVIAKAARLFYHPNDEQRPMKLGDFSDQFNNMNRRMWGLVAAVSDVLGDRSDSVGPGVLQLVEDAAREMERLSEAFDAERWIARHQEP